MIEYPEMKIIAKRHYKEDDGEFVRFSYKIKEIIWPLYDELPLIYIDDPQCDIIVYHDKNQGKLLSYNKMTGVLHELLRIGDHLSSEDYNYTMNYLLEASLRIRKACMRYDWYQENWNGEEVNFEF